MVVSVSLLYEQLFTNQLCTEQPDWEVVRGLVCSNKDAAHLIDRDRLTPLHYACWKKAPLDVIRSLYEVHPDALAESNLWMSHPLHTACRYYSGGPSDSAAVIEFLLQQYPAALQKKHNSTGDLPIHICCQYHQSYEVVSSLVEEWPACVREPNKVGNLPLHVACFYNCEPRVIQLLVNIYPESLTTIRNKGGKTPLDYFNASTAGASASQRQARTSGAPDDADQARRPTTSVNRSVASEGEHSNSSSLNNGNSNNLPDGPSNNQNNNNQNNNNHIATSNKIGRSVSQQQLSKTATEKSLRKARTLALATSDALAAEAANSKKHHVRSSSQPDIPCDIHHLENNENNLLAAKSSSARKARTTGGTAGGLHTGKSNSSPLTMMGLAVLASKSSSDDAGSGGNYSAGDHSAYSASPASPTRQQQQLPTLEENTSKLSKKHLLQGEINELRKDMSLLAVDSRKFQSEQLSALTTRIDKLHELLKTEQSERRQQQYQLEHHQLLLNTNSTSATNHGDDLDTLRQKLKDQQAEIARCNATLSLLTDQMQQMQRERDAERAIHRDDVSKLKQAVRLLLDGL